MGNKKRKQPTLQEVIERPWCYYCERDFDDLKILISHQKAKHYKCERCGRRLNTAGGLAVHLTQVHKEQLLEVDNALPNRKAPDIEIFGIEGIPDDVAQAHNQRVTVEYYQSEAAHRAATGNPPSGQGESVSKKPKIEDKDTLKARLAEFKAKKAAKAAGVASADSGSPNGSTPQPDNPNVPFQQPYPSGSQEPLFGIPQQPFDPAQGSPWAYGGPYGGPSPPPQGPFPGQFGPPPPQFSPPPQFAQPAAVYGYGPQGSPAGQGYPGNMPHQRPQPTGSPVHAGPPSRQNSLPSAVGLPQRPAFNPPPASRQQLKEMHNGYNPEQNEGRQPQNTATQDQASDEATSIDDLISSGMKQAMDRRRRTSISEERKPATPTQTAEALQPAPKEKKAAKETGKKPTRLVYSDNEVSPEEKLAHRPKYAFKRDDTPPTVLGPVEGAVTGVQQGPDDVRDAQD